MRNLIFTIACFSLGYFFILYPLDLKTNELKAENERLTHRYDSYVDETGHVQVRGFEIPPEGIKGKLLY